MNIHWYCANKKVQTFITLLVVFLFAPVSLADPVFRMAFGQNPGKESQYMFYKQIYAEAFKELGYEFQYKVCPSKRCSLDANRGRVDGEPQRILKYNETYKNMIRVEEPIFVNRSIAVITDPDIIINGLESLKNAGLRVDYIRGSVWSKKHLEPLVRPELLTEISTVEQAIRRLEINHSDVLIGLETMILRLLQKPEYQNTPVFIAGVVGENFSYPFIYKSHKELAPRLAEILRKMKEDGRFNKAMNRTMPFMSGQHAYNKSE